MLSSRLHSSAFCVFPQHFSVRVLFVPQISVDLLLLSTWLASLLMQLSVVDSSVMALVFSLLFSCIEYASLLTYSTQNATPYQTSVTNFTFFIFSTFLTSTFVVVASFRHTPCKFHAFNYRLLAKPILKFIATVLIPVNWQCLLNLTR